MKTINYFICISLYLLITSCYTLNSHQTGKTIGKHNSQAAIVIGLSDIPNSDKQLVNRGDGFIMLPNVTYQYGIGNTTDIGGFAGLAKSGLFFKQQFLGSKESKGAVSVGVNAFLGLEKFLFVETVSFAKVEAPFYLSWEFSKDITVYTSPIAVYSWEWEEVYNSDTISKSYFSNGLILGFMFNFGKKFTVSPEISVQRLQNSSDYQFYTTIGYGIIF